MFLNALLLAAVEVVAVYYPHWHRYPKGDEWFGPKWSAGEWEFVKNGKSRWPGHKPPIRPLVGCLDGKSPTDVETEIALASNAGIDVFLYDYYYYGGKVTQEEAIEQGFLKAKNRNLMKFALMWCYHERRDAFRIPIDGEDRFLMKLDRTPGEFLGLIDLSIERYFRAPEYWRKDGKLFFSIYNARDFIRSLGKDAAREAIAAAREKVRAAGLGEVNFNAQNVPAAEAADAKAVGFDSLTDYGFNAYHIPDMKRRFAAGEQLFDYSAADGPLQAHWDSHKAHDLPYYPIVPTGWDSTLRCRLEEPFPWKKINYPYGPSYTNVNPVVFEKYLRDAKRYVEGDPKRGNVVYVNAWNEYTEGCYLLPTVRESDQMLRCIGRVFGRKPADRFVFGEKRKNRPDAPNGRPVSVEAPTLENVKYGPHLRQGMDVWLPKKASAAPVPILVHIHGGGWVNGDRMNAGIVPMQDECRKRGIAFATITYRMLSDGRLDGLNPPVQACLADAVAAIRCVQDHAGEWKIDPKRIGLVGGSAGACSSLYASLQDDCALGIRAILANRPQTSLDPKEMREWIPNISYGAGAFGYRKFDDWLKHRADCLGWIERFSPVNLLRQCTAAKAPVFFYTAEPLPKPGKLPKDPTHAGMFCVKFRDACAAKGIRCEVGDLGKLLTVLAE